MRREMSMTGVVIGTGGVFSGALKEMERRKLAERMWGSFLIESGVREELVETGCDLD